MPTQIWFSCCNPPEGVQWTGEPAAQRVECDNNMVNMVTAEETYPGPGHGHEWLRYGERGSLGALAVVP